MNDTPHPQTKHQFALHIANGLALSGGFFLALLLVLVCANAGMRFFNLSLRGAVESSGLFGALAGVLALAYAQINGNHITGGVATHRLPKRLRILLDTLATVLSTGFFFLIAWSLWDLASFTLDSGETLEGVGALYPWLIMLGIPGVLGQGLVVLLTRGTRIEGY